MTFYTLPTSTNFIADIGEWSKPIFAELLPITLVVVGFTVGVLLAVFVLQVVVNAVKSLIKKDE